MGGGPNLLFPVGPDRRMSSWANHQWRNPRSSEPGTDFYCPIGTPVLAPADGWIYGHGESIAPATGRWVGINFDNGMAFRSLHHSRNVRTSGYVRRGDLIAYSGASGYGEEDWSWNPATGGAHSHTTLWPTHDKRFGYDGNGRPFTVDFMLYVGGSQFPWTPKPEEDDMFSDADRKLLDSVAKDASANRAQLKAIRLILGGSVQGGELKSAPNLINRLRSIQAMLSAGKDAVTADELEEIIAGITAGAGGSGLTPAQIQAAVEKGVRDGLDGTTVTFGTNP